MKCLVTVGATAPFQALIRVILSDRVLSVISELDYSELIIQHGDVVPPIIPKNCPLLITHFPFTPDMKSIMQGVDLVISHAGSGSILEALRMHKKLIVVPNELLMDNHQAELAQRMFREGYLISARATNDSLVIALEHSRTMKFNAFPQQDPETFKRILEVELGMVA